MTKERCKELLPIITAFAEGKEIESRIIGWADNAWSLAPCPSWQDNMDYRIAPPRPREFWIIVGQTGGRYVYDKPQQLDNGGLTPREIIHVIEAP